MATLEDLKRPGATEQQALDAGFDWARTLREKGAPTADFGAHREMYIDIPFRTSLLLPFVRAGFEAGYVGKPRPSIQAIKAAK